MSHHCPLSPGVADSGALQSCVMTGAPLACPSFDCCTTRDIRQHELIQHCLCHIHGSRMLSPGKGIAAFRLTWMVFELLRLPRSNMIDEWHSTRSKDFLVTPSTPSTHAMLLILQYTLLVNALLLANKKCCDTSQPCHTCLGMHDHPRRFIGPEALRSCEACPLCQAMGSCIISNLI